MNIIRERNKYRERKGESKEEKEREENKREKLGCYTQTSRQAEVKNSYTVALVYLV